MSKIGIGYAILFVLTVPALWLLAAVLDRTWPSNSERRGKKSTQAWQSPVARVTALART